jgi:hypothetical protein
MHTDPLLEQLMVQLGKQSFEYILKTTFVHNYFCQSICHKVALGNTNFDSMFSIS